MDITQKYVEFILMYLGDDTNVHLIEPKEVGDNTYTKLFPSVTIPVKIKVLYKYTRSANLSITFDKYTVEELFFITMNSSPDSISSKINKKISKIVNDTFINDGREDEIKKMYNDKRVSINEQIAKFAETLGNDLKK